MSTMSYFSLKLQSVSLPFHFEGCSELCDYSLFFSLGEGKRTESFWLMFMRPDTFLMLQVSVQLSAEQREVQT